jgi:F0F1-type ATP synthase membrane subunit b/b'
MYFGGNHSRQPEPVRAHHLLRLNAEAARVVDALRTQTAKLSVEKALASLPGKLNEAAQVQLIDRSIDALGEG